MTFDPVGLRKRFFCTGPPAPSPASMRAKGNRFAGGAPAVLIAREEAPYNPSTPRAIAFAAAPSSNAARAIRRGDVRRFLKFLHTAVGAALTGAAAALAVALMTGHTAQGAGQSTAETLAVLRAMSNIAMWIIGPSLVLTVISGLLAMVVTPAFQDVGWVWAKAATGIVLLQAGLHVIGPIQEEAKRAAQGADAARLVDAEINTLWLLLAISVANIALGVWRPRFPKYPV